MRIRVSLVRDSVIEAANSIKELKEAGLEVYRGAIQGYIAIVSGEIDRDKLKNLHKVPGIVRVEEEVRE